uniref:SpvB/TcaC N-terminal domain-containing protein n=1 Tax=Chryseobacterium sp. TaxID=1871047 RepID=UPI0023F22843
MRKPLLSVLRQNTKLLNSIIFFTCWSQLHAHANSIFLNKGDNVTPIMGVSSSPDRKIKNKEPEKSKDIPDSSNPKRKTGHGNKIQPANIAPAITTLYENDFVHAGTSGKTRYYPSDIKEGIIGTDADHPIDQVYDNIFTISLNEKINPAYQYTLEYDLYGAASYKEVSKVVNDELAAGGNHLQKAEGWMHQSEPISVSCIHQGINTIIFTIPHLSKYSYKVRNLQMGVSEKKQNLGSIDEKYNAATVSKFIANIGGTEKMSLGSAELVIPQGSLKSSESFSITALRDIDMPALSPEMVNVTSQNAGYRFLPHGEHFSAPAKVAIGYDKSKIPTGYTEQDVRTYYFDKQQKKWIALEKDTLNHQQSALISKTTHFTDMVNGILKVPESPETGSYAPNSIKDIKAANPSEGIVSIAPPAPNSMGSVTTNFPIKLPAGRAGIQPSLNVSYSSESGNGWMGMGWDMSIPAVSIDTRWGVPRYDSGKETEIYSLGGEQLTFEVSPGVFAMPNRNEGFEKGRLSDRQFYPRIEGAYNRIIRKGTNPTNYVWIVTFKDGTRSCFGGDENGNVIENAV